MQLSPEKAAGYPDANGLALIRINDMLYFVNRGRKVSI
jgi:hypothetical protein